MKMLRKISVLALVLVLVCMFSASAFAAPTSTISQSYGDDGLVRAYAEIDASGTSANIEMSVMEVVEDYFYIDLVCIYTTSTGIAMTAGKRAEFQHEAYGYLVFDEDDIKTGTQLGSMQAATYTYYAEFNSSVSFGTRLAFNPNPVTITP